MEETFDPLRCSREQLYQYGVRRVREFLSLNGLVVPSFLTEARFFDKREALVGKLTGYYDPFGVRIFVNVPKTASPVAKPGNRSWSYPGYKVDRTAVGVPAHEAGHHVHTLMLRARRWKGALWSDLARRERITGYEPNDSEAFAESMRLFILNPDLLNRGARRRYGYITEQLGLKPSESRSYRAVLNHHPDYMTAADKWIGA